MENKQLTIQEEMLNLKASAYDISREVNRLTAILQQINLRIEQLNNEANSQADDALTPPEAKAKKAK